MAKVNKFGTFGGVFTPSILTILGVIMYLRLPMIVGAAGLWSTLGIILIAHIISITTGLSVSSIATDKKVAAGGTYYMISRSLGLPIGGTLGLALFVGLSFSVSLYLIGFAESFLAFFELDSTVNTVRITGTIVLLAVTTITLISTSLAIKTQFFIMAAIVLSLFSILLGNHELTPTAAPSSEPLSTALPFMLLFGIFFPAVTGFEAGVSMSGDLADPKRSIPKGSVLAILTGLVVYIGLTVFFSQTVSREVLLNDPQVLLKISLIPQVVIAGIWGATLSSALGSILGAPRILQATAVDKITPRLFAKGVGETNEPRNALLLTFVIAECGILIGDLDIIARIVTIFFITTYGFLNLSCAFEAWASADFRPSFKTPVWVSLLGAVACFIVMIELDFVATLGATIILGCLYLYLKRRELVLQTGDTWAGVWSSLAKTALHRLKTIRSHTRNWRPNIVMFSGAAGARPYMNSLGIATAGKLGMLSSFELEVGDRRTKPSTIAETDNETSNIFRNRYVCNDIYKGIDEIVRVYGYAGIQPNTVLMGWSIRLENKDKFIALMDGIQRYNLNAMYLFQRSTTRNKVARTVDLWWSGWGRNLSFALNLLRHLTSSDTFQQATIRLFVILEGEEDSDYIGRFIRNVVSQHRMQVTIRLIDNHFVQKPRKDIIDRESADADLTIIGIPDSSYDDLEKTYAFGSSMCDTLPAVLFINACDTFDEHNVITSTGKHIAGETKPVEWLLPDLPKSPYPEIARDMTKVDARGLLLMEAVHRRIFLPAIKPESTIHAKLVPIIETLANAVTNALEHTQPFQRSTSITRSRKHLINKLVNILDESLEQIVPAQQEILEEGIKWYADQLEQDRNSFPKHIVVNYPKAYFEPSKDDSAMMRWYKFRRSLMHPFSRKSIGQRLNYREGASYFLHDLRFSFLQLLFYDLDRQLSATREDLRHFIAWVEESLGRIQTTTDAAEQEKVMRIFTKELRDRANSFKTHSGNLESLYKGRLQVEYRKNTINFQNQLEQIDFNNYIKRKARLKKRYLAKKEQLFHFPSKWSADATLDLTTLKVATQLLDYYGMVQRNMQVFIERFRQYYRNDQEKPAETLVTLLESLVEAPEKVRESTPPELSFSSEELLGKLRDTADQQVVSAAGLPEHSTVSMLTDGTTEDIGLPIRDMAIHLTETKLTGPVNDTVEDFIAKLERSNLIINDQANLAMFNVFNLSNEEDTAVMTEEIRSAITHIKKELQSISELFDAALAEIDKQGDDLRQSLRIHHLTSLSGDFSAQVRSQRQKRLQGRLSARFERIWMVIKDTFVSALYSRTKGVLLARQLSTSPKSLSVNERIMNVVARVTPRQHVIQKLPHYYISLFSGRSTIGDNFWVPRDRESKQLERGFQRYLENRQGMLLVMGERNTGKTALCKRFAESKAPGFSAYHVFAPEGGSVSLDDFGAALQKATKIDGNTHQILSLLPYNSMVVVHDLELWWERSQSSGLTVVRYLKSLVDEFATKCLFIVNMNPFAYLAINVAEPIDTHCAGVIRCVPFNSHELRQLIITRHKSSGLFLDFGSGVGEKLSEIRLARIFNSLFSVSKGNPGVVMNSWLSGIREFQDRVITWREQTVYDADVFSEFPPAWSHISLQLLLHKRMNLEKILRTVALDHEEIARSLSAMTRLRLLTVRGSGVYYLNPYVEFLFIAYFTEKEWI
jgi:amino acid transporter